jgi:putative FmdB family regulatory protein
MPIYEYRCEKCGVFDVMQKITDKPLRKCPTCKSKVAKQISNTAFQLKGSGWYITDYASKGKGAAKETPSEKSESKTESSADAKKPKEAKSESSGSSSTSTAAA